MQSDSDYCAKLLRSGDHDRFLSVIFAPPAARPALFALYAFNLELARIAETVSEAGLGLIRLQWWRDALEGMRAGKLADHPVVRALGAAQAQTKWPHFALLSLIDARERDFLSEPLPDLRALEAYAKATGGALQELAAACLGKGSDARSAQQLGTAWTLLGLLRAIPFHASEGRCYLPADALAAAQLVPPQLVASPALAAIVQRLAERAQLLLRDSGAKGVLTLLAKRHLSRLAQAQWNPFDGRVQRREPWRVFALLGAKLTGRLR